MKKMQDTRKQKQQAKEEELERKLEEKILARLNHKTKASEEPTRKRTSILRPASSKQEHEEKQVRFQTKASPKDVPRKRHRYEEEDEYESSDNGDSKSRDYSDESSDEIRLVEDSEDEESYMDEKQRRLNNIRAQISQGRSYFY